MGDFVFLRPKLSSCNFLVLRLAFLALDGLTHACHSCFASIACQLRVFLVCVHMHAMLCMLCLARVPALTVCCA